LEYRASPRPYRGERKGEIPSRYSIYLGLSVLNIYILPEARELEKSRIRFFRLGEFLEQG
jgi:hypothetical protein